MTAVSDPSSREGSTAADLPGKAASGLGQGRLSLEALRETLDALPSPILVVSPKHQVLLSNLAWRDLRAGMPSPEDRPYDAIAREFCEDQDEAEQLVALVDRAFTGEQTEPLRMRTLGSPDHPEARSWQVSARFVEHGPFAIVVHEDVTALARFEREQLEALRESDTRRHEALRIARAANWTWDRKTREVWQSGDLYEMLGYESMPADFESRVNLRHPDDRESSQTAIDHAMRKRQPFTVRYRLGTPAGDWVWIEDRGIPEFDPAGEFIGYRGTRQDVHEQVLREEALRESDDRQREALHVARATIWTWDYQTKAVWRSPELYQFLGLEDGPTSYERHIGFRHPDDRDHTRREAESAMRERRPFTIRYRMPRADGTWSWVEERGAPQYNAAGQYTGFRGTTQDIDEHVRREEALRESDDRQREALRIARAEIWTYDAKTRVSTQSDELLSLYGHELIPRTAEERLDMRHADDQERVLEEVRSAIRDRRPYVTRYRMIRADGTYGWIEGRGEPQYSADGEYIGYRGTRQDVDEQVRREQALRESDALQREALRIARAATWTFDAKSKLTTQSDDLFTLYGYQQRHDANGELLDSRHPDDRERSREEVLAAVRERLPYVVRYRMYRADGSYGWVEVRGEPQFSVNGDYVGYRGTRQDVDEQVRREDALRESDALQREALEIAHADFWTWDRATRALDISGNLLRYFGHESPPEEAAGHVALRHPDDREWSQREADAAVRARQPYTSRYRLARADGSWAWIEVRGVPLFDAAGDLIGYRGTRQDVDEQVRREAELRASYDRQREALQIARAELWTRDIATDTIVSSGEVYRLFGYEHTPNSRAESHALRHPDDEAVADRVIEEAVKAREPYVVRYRMARADGSWGWVEGRGVPEFDAGGTLVSYRGTRQDVDEQVRREEELREALKVARAGFWYRGRGDSATWWSPELYEMIGLPVADMPAADAAERHPDDHERVDRATRDAVYAHQPYTVRYRVRHTITREWVWVEQRGVPVFSADGTPIAYRGVVRDISDEIERQAELQRSEAFLEQAQRISHVGSFVVDLESGDTRWSDEQFRVLGYQPGEVAPSFEALLDRVHPDDRTTAREAIQPSVEAHEPSVHEYQVILPDGSVRYLNTIVDVRRDAEGHAAELLGASQDVTNRIEAERTIRQSEARLRGVLNSVGDGITLLTRDRRSDWANPAFLRMVGYTAEELFEQGPDSVFEDSALLDTTGWWRSVGQDGDTRLPRSYTLRLRRKDGTSISAEATPSVLKDGDEIIGMLSVIRDTTERDRLRSQIDAATEETRQILQTAPLPIFVVEADGMIAMANDSTAEAFGWTSDELLGRPVAALSSGLTPQALIVASARRAAAGTGGIDATEVLGRRRDGSEFPAQVAMTELWGADGGIRYLCVLIDLTDRKRAEEDLIRMQKTEALGTLVAGVSHDFNNLLTAMVGGITMAQEEPADARWLEIAKEAADRATRLVQQLLQFSRRSRPELQAIDPVALVERTAVIVRETIDRRIAVEVDVQSLNGTVAGDEGQLQQVVMNLLVNARDAVLERVASNETGYVPSIGVTLRMDRLGDGRAAQIEIQDNGAGMTAEVRARAFDPFFTTKPVGQGTGLGLATVAGIVEHHGGEIMVDSASGVGTTFTVRLPLFDTERTEAATPLRADRLAPVVTRTALVVDDEEMVRAVTTAYLEAAHYRVITVGDGNEAIRMLEAGSDIDVVLMDINMPSPNGWEILDRLRGTPGIPPIVVVSGYAEAEVASKRGAAGFLDKPFSQAELLDAFDEILSGQ